VDYWRHIPLLEIWNDAGHFLFQRSENSSPNGSADRRYVITVPAYLLTRCGINPLLALKFLQAIFFVLTYRLVLNHFKHQNLRIKTWYIALFSGPIFIFMSVLGLRDLALVYFSLYTIIGRNTVVRDVSWICAFLLRPHLAVALAFGRLVGFAYRHVRSYFHLLLLPFVVMFSFIGGTYSYVIGDHYQSGTSLEFKSLSHLLTQDTFTRFFANFGGLQFLLLGSDVVESSISNLFLLRLVFFDTFLIPILFILIVISGTKLRMRSVSIYSGFAFFLGLVSNTDFNSSRQNIPFLVLMGVTIAEHFAIHQRDRNTKQNEKSAIAPLNSSQSLTHT